MGQPRKDNTKNSHKKVLIIAEAGVNHNGDINIALNLVQAASNAGADIVKFQTFNTDKFVTNKAQKTAYQIKNSPNDGKTQKDMLKKLELSFDEHQLIKAKCDQLGIEFLSTAFDSNSLNFLNKLGLKRYKIPSGEITNLPYIREVASFGKPIIMSTGMATMQEINDAFYALRNCGIQKKDITILQCTSAYPTPLDEINLKVLETIKNEFDVNTGISDHSSGIAVAIGSVALGATIVEKHITLDRHLPGPDHLASIEEEEFNKMVQGIRDIEIALGDGNKKPTISELKNKKHVRKSLVAKRKISKGEKFSYENITCKRPGEGISPMKIDEIIGLVSKKEFEDDENIFL